MLLTKDAAKTEFARGLLASAEVIGVDGIGYKIKLTSALASDGSRYLLDSRHKQPRVFRSLDSAANVMRYIGFSTITVRAEV